MFSPSQFIKTLISSSWSVLYGNLKPCVFLCYLGSNGWANPSTIINLNDSTYRSNSRFFSFCFEVLDSIYMWALARMKSNFSLSRALWMCVWVDATCTLHVRLRKMLGKRLIVFSQVSALCKRVGKRAYFKRVILWGFVLYTIKVWLTSVWIYFGLYIVFPIFHFYILV